MLQRLDIIVVNDGSTDRTSEIAHQFEHDCPNVFRVIDKTNGNYGSCINVALPEAKGVYIKILDADDTFDTTVLSKYLSFLAALPEESIPDVVFNDFSIVDPSGRKMSKCDLSFTGNPDFSISMFDYSSGKELWMHSIAYRTSFLRTIGYRQTEGVSYTDQEWATIPMMKAFSFRYCSGELYRYLVGRSGQTVNKFVLYRHFSQHFIVAERIISDYLKYKQIADPEHLRFVKHQIEHHLLFFYFQTLVSNPIRCAEPELEKFDSFLKNADDALYRFPESFRCLRILGKERIPFVLLWRTRKTRMRHFVWLLFRYVYSIKSMLDQSSK